MLCAINTMSISLDPREVLQTLNAMGYRNITAEQLKEFTRGWFRFPNECFF